MAARCSRPCQPAWSGLAFVFAATDSLWNDRPYDAWAIFTGSATVVDGQVVQVYPGLCAAGGACRGMTTNTALCIAVPENVSDPLQTNWTKDGVKGGFSGCVSRAPRRELSHTSQRESAKISENPWISIHALCRPRGQGGTFRGISPWNFRAGGRPL